MPEEPPDLSPFVDGFVYKSARALWSALVFSDSVDGELGASVRQETRATPHVKQPALFADRVSRCRLHLGRVWRFDAETATPAVSKSAHMRIRVSGLRLPA